jgi:hypothetical protein
MPTSFLNLTTNTQASGSATTFLTWRLAMNDESNSNATKIDTYAQNMSASVVTLQSAVSYAVSATESTTDNYVATVTGFTSYTDKKLINLMLDVTQTGTTTLNINSLGTKTLYKIGSNGTAGNLDSGDLVAGRPNFFMYDTAGGYWLWVNGTSADQINIATTTNTEILLGSASGIIGSGISASSIGLVDQSNYVWQLGSNLTNERLITTGCGIGLVYNSSASTTAITSNIVPGIGMSISGSEVVTINGPASASSIAPSTASYVVLGADSVLTNERVLTAGSNINIESSASTVIIAMGAIPGMYERTNRITGSLTNITTPNRMMVDVNGALLQTGISSTLSVNTVGNWDSASYTSASSRAGKDFYIYACNSGLSIPTILFSNNSSAPSGYTSANSTKVGGFHCLCVAVGTISGHTLTGYVAGDILPASVWDLKWKPRSTPEGMVYSVAANIWVDIYLMSGTGVNTKSVNGGTISNTRNWMDFVDDTGAVGKRLLRDREFQLIAAGCNEGTAITGSADPGTTGGHVDTAGRRMISNIGCEDVAGTLWQWLDEQSYQYASTTAFGWVDQTGGKGQLLLQGATADVKLLAGGDWVTGANCGSRSRVAADSRWFAGAGIGGRAGVEPG